MIQVFVFGGVALFCFVNGYHGIAILCLLGFSRKVGMVCAAVAGVLLISEGHPIAGGLLLLYIAAGLFLLMIDKPYSDDRLMDAEEVSKAQERGRIPEISAIEYGEPDYPDPEELRTEYLAMSSVDENEMTMPELPDRMRSKTGGTDGESNTSPSAHSHPAKSDVYPVMRESRNNQEEDTKAALSSGFMILLFLLIVIACVVAFLLGFGVPLG